LEVAATKPFNLVLDEFQEFDRINPSVFSDMQNLWDQYRQKSKMNLVISGSVYTLMHKIFQDKGEPLFGRADNIMELKPFAPSTLKQILRDYAPSFKNDDLLALFTVTGGIPKYVELLCDDRALTVQRILSFAVRENSPFLEEGRNLLVTEFGKNYGTYFSILGAVSEGATTQSRIEDATGERDLNGHLKRLVEDYHVLSHVRPILAKKTSQTVHYELEDNFLRFWFAFFDKYQPMIELGNLRALLEIVKANYPTYSGTMLERYFKHALAETGKYREVGSWWDSRTSENQVDIVALAVEKEQALVAEVKRNRRNFRASQFAGKVEHLRAKALAAYEIETACLTLEDM